MNNPKARRYNDTMNEGGGGYNPYDEYQIELDRKIAKETAEREARAAAGTPTSQDIRHELGIANWKNPYHPAPRTYTPEEVAELERKLIEITDAENAALLAALEAMTPPEHNAMYTN